MSKLIQSPPCGRLAAKIRAIESGLDELSLVAHSLESDAATTPAIRSTIKVLEADYLPGLFTNPLSSQMAWVHFADSQVSTALFLLHRHKSGNTCNGPIYNRLVDLLGNALGQLQDIYLDEETRPRHYNRIGDERPNMKKPPKLDARPLSGKKARR